MAKTPGFIPVKEEKGKNTAEKVSTFLETNPANKAGLTQVIGAGAPSPRGFIPVQQEPSKLFSDKKNIPDILENPINFSIYSGLRIASGVEQQAYNTAALPFQVIIDSINKGQGEKAVTALQNDLPYSAHAMATGGVDFFELLGRTSRWVKHAQEQDVDPALKTLAGGLWAAPEMTDAVKETASFMANRVFDPHDPMGWKLTAWLQPSRYAIQRSFEQKHPLVEAGHKIYESALDLMGLFAGMRVAGKLGRIRHVAQMNGMSSTGVIKQFLAGNTDDLMAAAYKGKPAQLSRLASSSQKRLLGKARAAKKALRSAKTVKEAQKALRAQRFYSRAASKEMADLARKASKVQFNQAQIKNGLRAFYTKKDYTQQVKRAAETLGLPRSVAKPVMKTLAWATKGGQAEMHMSQIARNAMLFGMHGTVTSKGTTEQRVKNGLIRSIYAITPVITHTILPEAALASPFISTGTDFALNSLVSAPLSYIPTYKQWKKSGSDSVMDYITAVIPTFVSDLYFSSKTAKMYPFREASAKYALYRNSETARDWKRVSNGDKLPSFSNWIRSRRGVELVAKNLFNLNVEEPMGPLDIYNTPKERLVSSFSSVFGRPTEGLKIVKEQIKAVEEGAKGDIRGAVDTIIKQNKLAGKTSKGRIQGIDDLPLDMQHEILARASRGDNLNKFVLDFMRNQNHNIWYLKGDPTDLKRDGVKAFWFRNAKHSLRSIAELLTEKGTDVDFTELRLRGLSNFSKKGHTAEPIKALAEALMDQVARVDSDTTKPNNSVQNNPSFYKDVAAVLEDVMARLQKQQPVSKDDIVDFVSEATGAVRGARNPIKDVADKAKYNVLPQHIKYDGDLAGRVPDEVAEQMGLPKGQIITRKDPLVDTGPKVLEGRPSPETIKYRRSEAHKVNNMSWKTGMQGNIRGKVSLPKNKFARIVQGEQILVSSGKIQRLFDSIETGQHSGTFYIPQTKGVSIDIKNWSRDDFVTFAITHEQVHKAAKLGGRPIDEAVASMIASERMKKNKAAGQIREQLGISGEGTQRRWNKYQYHMEEDGSIKIQETHFYKNQRTEPRTKPDYQYTPPEKEQGVGEAETRKIVGEEVTKALDKVDLPTVTVFENRPGVDKVSGQVDVSDATDRVVRDKSLELSSLLPMFKGKAQDIYDWFQSQTVVIGKDQVERLNARIAQTETTLHKYNQVLQRILKPFREKGETEAAAANKIYDVTISTMGTPGETLYYSQKAATDREWNQGAPMPRKHYEQVPVHTPAFYLSAGRAYKSSAGLLTDQIRGRLIKQTKDFIVLGKKRGTVYTDFVNVGDSGVKDKTVTIPRNTILKVNRPAKSVLIARNKAQKKLDLNKQKMSKVESGQRVRIFKQVEDNPAYDHVFKKVPGQKGHRFDATKSADELLQNREFVKSLFASKDQKDIQRTVADIAIEVAQQMRDNPSVDIAAALDAAYTKNLSNLLIERGMPKHWLPPGSRLSQKSFVKKLAAEHKKLEDKLYDLEDQGKPTEEVEQQLEKLEDTLSDMTKIATEEQAPFGLESAEKMSILKSVLNRDLNPDSIRQVLRNMDYEDLTLSEHIDFDDARMNQAMWFEKTAITAAEKFPALYQYIGKEWFSNLRDTLKERAHAQPTKKSQEGVSLGLFTRQMQDSAWARVEFFRDYISDRILQAVQEQEPNVSRERAQELFKMYQSIMSAAHEEIATDVNLPANKVKVTYKGQGGKYGPGVEGKGTEEAGVKHHVEQAYKVLGKQYDTKNFDTRPRLLFFNMLPDNLKRLVIGMKRAETRLLLDKSYLFPKSNLSAQMDEGYVKRLWEITKKNNKQSQEAIRDTDPQAQKYRTYSEYRRYARGVKVVDNYSLAMGKWFYEMEERSLLHSTLKNWRVMQNPDNPNLRLIEYDHSIQAKAKALGLDLSKIKENPENAIRNFLEAKGYEQMNEASALADYAKGHFRVPWVHRSLAAPLRDLYKARDRSAFFKAASNFNYITKRMIMWAPHLFYAQVLSTPMTWYASTGRWTDLKEAVQDLNPVRIAKKAGGVVRAMRSDQAAATRYLQELGPEKLRLYQMMRKSGAGALQGSTAHELFGGVNKYASELSKMESGTSILKGQAQKDLDVVVEKFGVDRVVFDQMIEKHYFNMTETFYKIILNNPDIKSVRDMPKLWKEQGKRLFHRVNDSDYVVDNRTGQQRDPMEAMRLATTLANDVIGILNPRIYGREAEFLHFAMFARDFNWSLFRQITGALGLHTQRGSGGKIKGTPVKVGSWAESMLHSELTYAQLKQLQPFYLQHLAQVSLSKMLVINLLNAAMVMAFGDEERKKRPWAYQNEEMKRLMVWTPWADSRGRRRYVDLLWGREFNNIAKLMGPEATRFIRYKAAFVPNFIFRVMSERDLFGRKISASPLQRQRFLDHTATTFRSMLPQPLTARRGDKVTIAMSQFFGTGLRSGAPVNMDSEKYHAYKRAQDKIEFEDFQTRRLIERSSPTEIQQMVQDRAITPEQYRRIMMKKQWPEAAMWKNISKKDIYKMAVDGDDDARLILNWDVDDKDFMGHIR